VKSIICGSLQFCALDWVDYFANLPEIPYVLQTTYFPQTTNNHPCYSVKLHVTMANSYPFNCTEKTTEIFCQEAICFFLKKKGGNLLLNFLYNSSISEYLTNKSALQKETQSRFVCQILIYLTMQNMSFTWYIWSWQTFWRFISGTAWFVWCCSGDAFSFRINGIL